MGRYRFAALLLDSVPWPACTPSRNLVAGKLRAQRRPSGALATPASTAPQPKRPERKRGGICPAVRRGGKPSNRTVGKALPGRVRSRISSMGMLQSLLGAPTDTQEVEGTAGDAARSGGGSRPNGGKTSKPPQTLTGFKLPALDKTNPRRPGGIEILCWAKRGTNADGANTL